MVVMVVCVNVTYVTHGTVTISQADESYVSHDIRGACSNARSPFARLLYTSCIV